MLIARTMKFRGSTGHKQIRNCGLYTKADSFPKKASEFQETALVQGQFRLKVQAWKTLRGFFPKAIEMTEENWSHDFAKSLAIFLNGEGIRTVGPKGERTVDNSFYVMFNAHYEGLDFKLPQRKYGSKWMK